jgi:hypothetical protein
VTTRYPFALDAEKAALAPVSVAPRAYSLTASLELLRAHPGTSSDVERLRVLSLF